MTCLSEDLVRRIHDCSAQLVLVLNGGSRAITELLEVPGGSKVVLEASVPYSEGALTAWLGSQPEQFCSSRTARAMAVIAFDHATRYGANQRRAVGLSCTASLTTDRPKRGPHRAHIAVQTAAQTRHCTLGLEKGARSRQQEEQIVSRMVLNAAAEACGVDQRLDLALLGSERIENQQVTAPPSWQDLFLGHVEAIRADENCDVPKPLPRVIFSGAFDPLHDGHRRMAEIAQEALGYPVTMEISIHNVDKPALDYLEIDRRLKQFVPGQPVWLTRAATFDAKSRLFPGATFVVGVDTMRRIIDPRYYGNDRDSMLQSLKRILARDCRFLVFGRMLESSFMRISDLDLSDELRRACIEIPPEQFRNDVSSTLLRQADAE
jgi:nicotinamide mononucleotide (NMN) deamidase PncC